MIKPVLVCLFSDVLHGHSDNHDMRDLKKFLQKHIYQKQKHTYQKNVKQAISIGIFIGQTTRKFLRQILNTFQDVSIFLKFLH